MAEMRAFDKGVTEFFAARRWRTQCPVPRSPPRPTAPTETMTTSSTAAVSRLAWLEGKPLSGRYPMRSKLGEGGMGTVYLADDLLLGRVVAVKALFDEDQFADEDLARFRKEVAAAHAVHHPNVARTYDLGASGGVQYLTMEHLPGETLMSRIRKGKVPSDELIEIAVPLCEGLRAAHKAGVVHRDLKPANVMLVGGERKVAIRDFGIARTMAEATGEDLTQSRKSPSGHYIASTPWDVTSAGLGTPAYMAPERWNEQHGDPRTDIDALGVILYVALTGKAPYAATTADEMGEMHKSVPIPDVRQEVKEVPAHLARLIA
jgi:serine/threonine-protein kinase